MASKTSPSKRIARIVAQVDPNPTSAATSFSSDLPDIDVDQVAYGFMASQALFTGLEAGVFDHIASKGDKPVSIQELQELTGINAPRLQTLVTALTAMRALRFEQGDGYLLSPNSAKFLARSSKQFYGDYLRLQMGRQFYGHMASLPDAVMEGKAPDYTEWFKDPSEAECYTKAQHNGSMATARQLLKRVDLRDARSVLDVGGGSGAFAIQLCRHLPELRVVILELPEVCKTGEDIVSTEPASVSSRVRFVRGSCLGAWPQELSACQHDLVLMSYVSGSVPSSEIQVMYRKAFTHLRPGGRLLVHDFAVDDTMDGPELGALWALQHVAVNAEGVGLTPSLISGIMEESGFVRMRSMEMINGMTKVVIGEKPSP